VGDFHVVDIPRDGALLAVDGGVGDAKIVWIEDKSFGGQDGCEKFVPEKPAHDAAVDGFIAADI
jgi:hypothetical protein